MDKLKELEALILLLKKHDVTKFCSSEYEISLDQYEEATAFPEGFNIEVSEGEFN